MSTWARAVAGLRYLRCSKSWGRPNEHRERGDGGNDWRPPRSSRSRVCAQRRDQLQDETYLTRVIRFGHEAAARELIEAGADVEQGGGGHTPLTKGAKVNP